jgi:hypothetical protein
LHKFLNLVPVLSRENRNELFPDFVLGMTRWWSCGLGKNMISALLIAAALMDWQFYGRRSLRLFISSCSGVADTFGILFLAALCIFFLILLC